MQRLSERLNAEPSVAGVALTSNLPGTYHEWRRVEVDGGGETHRTELDEKGPGRWVRGGLVVPGFFEVLGLEPLAGRTFNSEDEDPEARTVVVNQALAKKLFGERNPIGRRLRYLASPDGWDGVTAGDPPGPWYQIVGVVPNLAGGAAAQGDLTGLLYHAVPSGNLRTSNVLVHVNGDAESFTNPLREIAREVDPELALVDLQTPDRAREDDLRPYDYWFRLIVGISATAILLSLAGIYAVMSFAVTRRTREIGVRVALGAGPSRIAWVTVRRPLTQIAGGVLVGLLLCVVLAGGIGPHPWWRPLAALLGYAGLMTTVCLLACAVPMRRALAVEPIEALSVE